MAHPSFSDKRVILHPGQLFCTHNLKTRPLEIKTTIALIAIPIRFSNVWRAMRENIYQKSAAIQFLFNYSLLFFYFYVFVVVVVTQTRYKRYHALPRKKSWNKIISFKKLPTIWWKRRMQSRYLYIHVNRVKFKFYDNWANPRALIGRELWSMK